MILSPFKLFVEKCPETTIVNCFYSCLCYQSRIFEMFLVVFLQKFCCFLYFYLSSWDLFLKKLLCNLDLFINFLRSSFATKRGFICSKIFLFDWNMFIKYIKYCFLEFTYVIFTKCEIVYIVTELRIVKFFVIAICYNFW